MNYDFSVGKGEKIIYVDDLYRYVVDIWHQKISRLD